MRRNTRLERDAKPVRGRDSRPPVRRDPTASSVPARPEARRGYHHGALRESLLAAVEAILREGGLEALTLRECARRAGVSHAAPAHHFGDVRGLLSAYAATGFARLAETMERYAGAAGADPLARLRAVGQAYVDFALAHPEHFRLMFRRERLDCTNAELTAAAHRAASLLRTSLSQVAGERAPAAANGDARALLAWSAVHGFATLALEGQLGSEYGVIEGDAASAGRAAHQMLALLGASLRHRDGEAASAKGRRP